jgi:alpha-ketoglutarate-dependent taurine dioxygenase
VLQQSWWNIGTELRKLPMIKNHPIITERKSLRLNYYVTPTSKQDAWILKSYFNDQEISNQKLIGGTIVDLLKKQNLKYEHTWDVGDIAIYDNWSFVHGRTPLILQPGEVREFIRANIDHMSCQDFKSKTFFNL